MQLKRKTTVQQSSLALHLGRRKMSIQPKLDQGKSIDVIIEIILQFIETAEAQILKRQQVLQMCSSFMSQTDRMTYDFFELDEINHQNIVNHSEQPQPCKFYPIVVPPLQTRRNTITNRVFKEKSLSCENNEDICKKQKYRKIRDEMKRCKNNQLVELRQLRFSNDKRESQTSYDEILQLYKQKQQSLLPQLRLDQSLQKKKFKQRDRAATERRQKKVYIQHDDGKGELIVNKMISINYSSSITNLENIRYVPGQQIVNKNELKKRPIIQLFPKQKRKDIANLCVFMQELDGNQHIGDRQIPKTAEMKKGSTLTLIKNERTATKIKYPSIR